MYRCLAGGRARTPRHSRTAQALIGSSHSAAAASYLWHSPHAVAPVPATAAPASVRFYHSARSSRLSLHHAPPLLLVRGSVVAVAAGVRHLSLYSGAPTRNDPSVWSLPADTPLHSPSWELEVEAREFEPDYAYGDEADHAAADAGMMSPYVLVHKRLRQLTSQLSEAAHTGDWKRAGAMVEHWTAAGMQLDVVAFNAWLECFVHAREWAGAEAAWARMPELGLSPNAGSYRALIAVFMASGQADQLAKIEPLYAEMQGRYDSAGRPLHFSARDLEQLIHASHRYRLRSEVCKWAQRAKEAGVWDGFNRRFDNTLRLAEVALGEERLSRLRGLARTGDWAAADRLVAATLAGGSPLDVDAFNAWLGCYVRSAQWRAAELAWAHMAQLRLQPNAATYCAFICVLIADGAPGQLAKADALYAEMCSGSGPVDLPLRFSARHFDRLIQGVSDRRLGAAEVRKWVERAHAAGVRHQLSESSLKILTSAEKAERDRVMAAERRQSTLMRGLLDLVATGEWSGAERLITEAAANGVPLTTRIATLWLACHDRSGEWRGAEKVWRRMAELGLAPSAVSYRALIQVFTVNGEAEQLGKIDPLYEEMTSGSGPAGAPLQFSVRDFGHLIKTAHRCRLAAEARRWAERARTAGVWDQLDEASRDIVATVDKWEEEARAILREQQQSALKSELLALAKAGDWAGAERRIAEAEASGTQINTRIATLWLACYTRSGEWRGAEAVWRRMAELSLAPDAASYCTLIQVYMASGEVEQLAKIEPLYTEMTAGSVPARAPLQFSARHFGQLIKAAHRCRLGDQARQWADRAKAAGLLDQLDETSRRIAATVADWEHHPRAAGAGQPDPAGAGQPDPAGAGSSSAGKAPVANVAPDAIEVEHLSQETRELPGHAQHDQSVTISWKVALQAHAATGDWAAAEGVVAEAEAEAEADGSGAKLDAADFRVWLGSYESRGEWRGAEAAWARMAQRGVKHDAACYIALVRVYMADGQAEQLVKADALFAELVEAATAAAEGAGADAPSVQLQPSDYSALIRAAHHYRLGHEARLWSSRAVRCGAWELLDPSAHDTLACVAAWELEPRTKVVGVSQEQWAGMLEQAGEVLAAQSASAQDEGADPAGSSAARHDALAAAGAADEALNAAVGALEHARAVALHARQLRLAALEPPHSEETPDPASVGLQPRTLQPESDAQRMQRHVVHASAVDAAAAADEWATRAAQLHARATKLLATVLQAARR